MATTLVTGGAGFIGSHVCERLLSRGDRVVCLDNFDPFYDRTLKARNIEGLLCNARFIPVVDDILNREALIDTIKKHGVEQILNFAARPGVSQSLTDPGAYQTINLIGATNVMDAARACGIPRVVLASSSSVYGATPRLPCHEEESPLVPLSPYAVSKLAMEVMAATYQRLYGLETVCLRFFTVYGPRQRPDMAIPLFVERILAGRPITIYGDGTSERDYTFVGDIVDGIIRAADQPPGVGRQVLNLGSSEAVSIRRLVDTLGELLGVSPRVSLQPDRPGDAPATLADISKAAACLGYHPRVRIREGLAAYLTWANVGVGGLSKATAVAA
ncbi:MAG TPA: NAD-dependent epimerase/dehydratase family protein [Armatimonadota bacterium]|jgi:UDP-glucuronate 4-epimerase